MDFSGCVYLFSPITRATIKLWLGEGYLIPPPQVVVTAPMTENREQPAIDTPEHWKERVSHQLEIVDKITGLLIETSWRWTKAYRYRNPMFPFELVDMSTCLSELKTALMKDMKRIKECIAGERNPEVLPQILKHVSPDRLFSAELLCERSEALHARHALVNTTDELYVELTALLGATCSLLESTERRCRNVPLSEEEYKLLPEEHTFY